MSRWPARPVALLLAAAAACSRSQHPAEPKPDPEHTADQRGSGGGVPPAPGRPPAPAAPEGLLREGVVAEIQRDLARRGLLGDHRSGELDAPTSAAIRKFQAQRALAATGFPDRETLKDLGIDPERAYVSEADRRRQQGEARGADTSGSAEAGGSDRR